MTNEQLAILLDKYNVKLNKVFVNLSKELKKHDIPKRVFEEDEGVEVIALDNFYKFIEELNDDIKMLGFE